MEELKFIFQKIDKSKYPKTVRSWSFSAFFFNPVFVIGNKLWSFTIVYLVVYFFKLFILRYLTSSKFAIITMFCVFAAYFIILVFLLIYGRILAWNKLKYRNNEQDIRLFNLRQKSIRHWGILLFIAETLTMYFVLSMKGF